MGRCSPSFPVTITCDTSPKVQVKKNPLRFFQSRVLQTTPGLYPVRPHTRSDLQDIPSTNQEATPHAMDNILDLIEKRAAVDLDSPGMWPKTHRVLESLAFTQDFKIFRVHMFSPAECSSNIHHGRVLRMKACTDPAADQER